MKLERRRAGSVKRLVVLIVLMCIAMVLVWSWATVHYSEDKVVEREMEKIARDYYENYFYDKYIEIYKTSDQLDLKEAMQKASENGFQEVLLRQLLLFDNSRWEESRKIFENELYACDTNQTSVVFFPVEPYGRRDYTMHFSYSCKSL